MGIEPTSIGLEPTALAVKLERRIVCVVRSDCITPTYFDLYRVRDAIKLVLIPRVELGRAAYETAALPLSYTSMVAQEEVESPTPGYEPSMMPFQTPRVK